MYYGTLYWLFKNVNQRLLQGYRSVMLEDQGRVSIFQKLPSDFWYWKGVLLETCCTSLIQKIFLKPVSDEVNVHSEIRRFNCNPTSQHRTTCKCKSDPPAIPISSRWTLMSSAKLLLNFQSGLISKDFHYRYFVHILCHPCSSYMSSPFWPPGFHIV